MRILCLVRQVPDSNATIKVLDDGAGLDMTSVKMVLDPFDEFGVELAVQLREKGKSVEEIVAITIGGDKAAEALRTALAMGADRAIHINEPELISKDEIFTAHVMAEAIKKEDVQFDLILCGKQTIDLESGSVGPALAEFLELPHVSAVTVLELGDDDQSFTANRRIEGAEEIVECDLPALLTIEKGLVEPRYPSLPNLMKAKKKPVTVLNAGDLPGASDIGVGSVFESMSPPPLPPDCRFIEGEPEVMAKELARLLREEAKVI